MNQQALFHLFETDPWHTHSSKNLIETFASKFKAMEYLKSNEDLSENDLFNLEQINQTQGREINFVIEEKTLV